MTALVAPRRLQIAATPLLALVLLLAAQPAVAVDSSSPARTGAETAAEQEMLDGHDTARRDPGSYGQGGESTASTLVWAEDLAHVARNWSDRMADSGGLEHNPDLTSQACCWLSIGENVAFAQPIAHWGSAEAAAQHLMQGWMDSDEHRTNIMDGGLSQVGIGVTIDDQDGMWATAVFRDPDGQAPPGTAAFIDVPEDHPHADGIVWMADEEITIGYDDHTFRLGSPVIRGAMATFLHRLSDEPDAPTPTFPDVPDHHPHADGIGWLEHEDVAAGFDDSTFRPGSSVTRGAMATFVHRYATGS